METITIISVEKKELLKEKLLQLDAWKYNERLFLNYFDKWYKQFLEAKPGTKHTLTYYSNSLNGYITGSERLKNNPVTTKSNITLTPVQLEETRKVLRFFQGKQIRMIPSFNELEVYKAVQQLGYNENELIYYFTKFAAKGDEALLTKAQDLVSCCKQLEEERKE